MEADTPLSFTLGRRSLALGLLGSAALLAAEPAGAVPPRRRASVARDLAKLEADSGVLIGVRASSSAGATLGHRHDTAFPMCSLFKTLAVGSLLSTSAYDDAFWATEVHYTADEIVVNSPITSTTPDMTLTYAQLADAALRYSDNTAGNLLLRRLGGPPSITTFARSLGAHRTRLDRWEPDLNDAVPGDPRDTSTPGDIHLLYRALLLGDALDHLGRAMLLSWMLRNTTSSKRIGSALPAGAELADKTGAGDYGVVNDAGVVFAGDASVCLAIMTRTDDPSAAASNEVVAAAARIVLDALR